MATPAASRTQVEQLSLEMDRDLYYQPEPTQPPPTAVIVD